MKLGVNIDHIATLRNARGGVEPNLVEAAKIILKENIHSLTMHLREDRRHIKDNDLYDIKKIDLNNTTFKEAFDLLYNIQQSLNNMQ